MQNTTLEKWSQKGPYQ